MGARLLQAAYCGEARQDWETAEQYYKAVSQRYANAFYHWYLFCRRTGQGSLKEAIQPVSTHVGQGRFFARGQTDPLTKIYYLLEGETDPLKKLLAPSDLAADRLHPALLHDATKDVEERNRLLDLVTQTITPEEQVHKEIAENFQDDIWQGEKSTLTLAKAEEITKGKSPLERAVGLYYIGFYLSHHGKAEEAIKCWQEVMGFPDIGNPFRTFSGAELVRAMFHPRPIEADCNRRVQPKNQRHNEPADLPRLHLGE